VAQIIALRQITVISRDGGMRKWAKAKRGGISRDGGMRDGGMEGRRFQSQRQSPVCKGRSRRQDFEDSILHLAESHRKTELIYETDELKKLS